MNDAALWPLPLSFSITLAEHEQFGSIDLTFAPNGQYLFSASGDGTIRSWPLSGRIDEPTSIVLKEKFGAFPRLELDSQAKRFVVSGEAGRVLVANVSFTNLRVVPDSNSSTGWKLDVGPFPGWEKVPGW